MTHGDLYIVMCMHPSGIQENPIFRQEGTEKKNPTKVPKQKIISCSILEQK